MCQTNQNPLIKGTLLKGGKYEIISDTHNDGGFGRIYQATNLQTEEIVAVKEFYIGGLEYEDDFDKTKKGLTTFGRFYKYHLSLDTSLIQFKNEVSILKKLNEQHDHHVPVIFDDVFVEDNRSFYAMSWIEGETLLQHMENNEDTGLFTEEEAVTYITQIAKVLYKAHKFGVMHCDISPNNIMLENGLAKLVDFGNAKSYYTLKDLDFDQIQFLTKIGTIGYMAPASVLQTPQADIYSLASTLYYLLTGECTFSKDDKTHIFDLTDIQETLESHRVSKSTIKAIMKALDVDSPKCITSAEEFLNLLPSKIVFKTLLDYNDSDIYS